MRSPSSDLPAVDSVIHTADLTLRQLSGKSGNLMEVVRIITSVLSPLSELAELPVERLKLGMAQSRRSQLQSQLFMGRHYH
jgi:hypothetical protein